MGTPESKLRVFVSYRRDDSADVSGRIDDRLVASFGRENVFKDVDSIPVGVDFRSYLDSAIGDCDVLLVIVGKQWASVTDDEGNRRLDDETDFVRIEVESALARNIPVIPVLVGGATMPKPSELAEALREFSFRSATQVRRDPDFHSDASRLIKAIKNAAAISPPLPSEPPQDERTSRGIQPLTRGGILPLTPGGPLPLTPDGSSAKDKDNTTIFPASLFPTIETPKDSEDDDWDDEEDDDWEDDEDWDEPLTEADVARRTYLVSRRRTRRRILIGVALVAILATVIGGIINAFFNESDWRDESLVPPLTRLNSPTDPKHSSKDLRRQIISVALMVEQGASLEKIADDIVDRFHLLETWMFADLPDGQRDELRVMSQLAEALFGRMPSPTPDEILEALPSRGFAVYLEVIFDGIRSRIESGERLAP